MDEDELKNDSDHYNFRIRNKRKNPDTPDSGSSPSKKISTQAGDMSSRSQSPKKNYEDESNYEDDEIEDSEISDEEDLKKDEELLRIKKYIKDTNPTVEKILKSGLEFHDKCKLYSMYQIYKELPISTEKMEQQEAINDLMREKSNVGDHEREENLKRSIDYASGLRNRILNSRMPDNQRAIVFVKYLKFENCNSSEREKLREWIEYSLNIPQTIKPVFEDVINEGRIYEFLTHTRKVLDDNLYGLDRVKTEILMILNQILVNPQSGGNSLAIVGSPGTGKCLALNTPILMFDGKIKCVQDIVVGDILMGDDSTPRNVLALGRGRDDMYKITHKNDDSYTVNSEHILCLKYSEKKRIRHEADRYFDGKKIKVESKSFTYNTETQETKLSKATEYLNSIKENRMCEISVKDYLKLGKSLMAGLREYSTGVNFPDKEIDFDPYIIGYWLGDGTATSSQITTQDSAVLKYLVTTLPNFNCYLRCSTNYHYRINGVQFMHNSFLQVLKNNNMLKNKHIPSIYKCNSRSVRLALLAGIIDSDGYLEHDKATYEISQSKDHMKLVRDIIFLIKSLGFGCSFTARNTSYRIFFSGSGIEEIPVKIKRKKANPRKQIKDALVSDIEIEPQGQGDYYGFTLDGNGKFVLGNFIVTHNTELIRTLATAIDLPFEQISLGGCNNSSFLDGHSYTYEGSSPGIIVKTLCKFGSKRGIIFFDEFDKLSQTEHGLEVSRNLLHITDSTQNCEFRDKYLAEIKIDLSYIWFIYSLNDENMIDSVLRDRIPLIRLSGYSMDDKINIAKRYIIPKTSKKMFLDEKDVVFGDDILRHIIGKTNEAGVRKLKEHINRILGRVLFLKTLHQNNDDNSFKMTVPFDIRDFKFPLVLTIEKTEKLMEVDSVDENISKSMMYL